MNPKGETQYIKRFDGVKWTLVIVLLVALVVLNYFYSNVAWGIRAAAGLIIAGIALAIASQTQKGYRAWEFIKGARGELRKVSWPSRKETGQTTLVVVAMVILIALILWGLDSFFIWFIAWLTGQRG